MAASLEPIPGEYYLVQISQDSGTSWEDLGFLTENGLTRTAESIDRSSKQNCNWASSRAGRRGWTVTGSGYLSNGAITSTLAFYEIEAIWAAGTTTDVRVMPVDCSGAEIVDEYQWSGKAYFTDLSQSHPDQEESTYTFTLQGTDALTAAIVTVP
jgi:hypothetical protein